jgi:hypothetical protein
MPFTTAILGCEWKVYGEKAVQVGYQPIQTIKEVKPQEELKSCDAPSLREAQRLHREGEKR